MEHSSQSINQSIKQPLAFRRDDILSLGDIDLDSRDHNAFRRKYRPFRQFVDVASDDTPHRMQNIQRRAKSFLSGWRCVTISSIRAMPHQALHHQLHQSKDIVFRGGSVGLGSHLVQVEHDKVQNRDRAAAGDLEMLRLCQHLRKKTSTLETQKKSK